MTTVIRHGAAEHFLRPDGVMRTSVIQPFVGFSPDADVQAIARAFTQGGLLATTLAGLGDGGSHAGTWASGNRYTPAFRPRFAKVCPMGTVVTATAGGGWVCAPSGGFYGFGQPGPIKRWWLGVKARMAARRMTLPPVVFSNTGGNPGPSTEIIVSSQVAPQMQAQMTALEHLTRNLNQTSIRGPIAAASQALRMRRPFTYYRAG